MISSIRHRAPALARTLFLAHAFFMLTDEQTSPEQFAALRAMTGARRLRLAERLYWSARKLKAAGLQIQHPDWPEPRVNEEVRRIFSHART
jgi:hypothetical protein